VPNDLSHRTNRKLSPGRHFPLGATLGPGGVNFSLYSATAEEVWLLLFDRPDGEPTDIIRFYVDDFLRAKGLTNYWGYNTASFFDAVSQDPALQKAKLIAEPWDLGSYEVGNFPVDWSEWNGRFRDTVRRFVKGDGGQLRDLGFRLTGSADLYADDGRSAYNSVNFVTCHDGFTLRDLVSYNGKHNEANLEGNRDGTDDNNSWNCGAEGETDDPEIVRLRRRLAKNHACLLLFSSGTPMILGGDEFLRTQGGNNNGYCQDNPISWFDWGEVERNGEYRQREVMVPPLPSGLRWRRAIDTSLAEGEDFVDDGAELLPDPADRYLVDPRTTVVLLGM
jgi:pullulanase/glycogen debranching enzyme